MTVPGPGLASWAVELVAFALAATLAGEGARALLARRVPWFRVGEPVERGVLDLYLGGALLYLLAVLPLDLYRPAIVAAGWTVAAVFGAYGIGRGAGRVGVRARIGAVARTLRRLPYLLTFAGAALLFAVEVAAATGVPTGNTFDSSVDATFTALLTFHGQTSLTLQPVSAAFSAYPQGPAAWFAAAGWSFGWSPAQVPLLVTPLFMAIVPLAAFVLGRRWLGREGAAAILAVGGAVLLPGTRYFAGGSNDFVLAFPLVLYLAARAREWVPPARPRALDAVAFGAVVGYSAALNPTGAEWLLTSLLVVGVAGTLPSPRALGRWTARWTLAGLVALVPVVPSIAALTLGAVGPRSTGVAGGHPGITFAQFVGWSDPFLFGTTYPNWSPVLGLQIELAALLTVGAALLWVPGLRSAGPPEYRGWLAAGIVSALAWELVAVAAGAGASWAIPFTEIGSAGQSADLLFLALGLVALTPIVEWTTSLTGERSRSDPPAPLRPFRPGSERPSRSTVVAVALLVLLPGVVATSLWLPAENHREYDAFSRVTAADFALLAAAPQLLPPGARVLVAPGSAAEFLPAYDPTVTLLFPMTGAAWSSNATYLALRASLANGTLGSNGSAELRALGVGFIAITGNDTVLFPAFSPDPFLNQSGFLVLFHDADAYLFADGAGGPPPRFGAAG